MERTAHFLHEHYGIPHDLLPPVAELDRLGKAILIIAAADRELSDEELNFFLALAESYGASPELRDELRRFDYRRARLDDHLVPADAYNASSILYDAIRVASADGRYAVQERVAVRRLASLIGLDDRAVTAIEGLVEAEHALAQLRVALLRMQPASLRPR